MPAIRTKLFETVTSKVKSTAKTFDPNSQVILFGSRARGDYRKDSDWDFLILMDRKVNEKLKEEIREKIYDSTLSTFQGITSFVENKQEWNEFEHTDLHKNISKDGLEI
jgi:uncharacterized protein